MAKYHVNNRGEAGLCRATQSCPFGDLSADHYPTPEAARTAYEAKQGDAAPPAVTKKPDVKDEKQTLITSVKASQLKAGDDYQGEEISSVKVGRKWVTLSTPKHREILLPTDEEVAVLREEPTERAKEAQRQDMNEWVAESQLKSVEKSLESAYSRVREGMEKGRVDDHAISSLMNAQARESIAARIRLRAENTGEPLSVAAESVREGLRERMSDYLIKSGLSRSTSVISNAMEDAQNEAILEFVRNGLR